MNRQFSAVLVLTPLLVLGLAACGGDSAAEGSESAATSAAAEGEGGPGGGNSGQFQQIQECLTAAGIELPDMGERPTGMPSGGTGERPTDMPTDMPSDRPSGAPGEGGGSGGPGGAGGGMSEILQDEDAQAALEACGLEVPSGRPEASAT